MIPTHQVIEKICILTWVAKAETHSRHKPISLAKHHTNWKGTPNSELLPEAWKVWTIHLALQLLRLPDIFELLKEKNIFQRGTLPSKVVCQNWRREKISQTKVKGVHHHYTSLTTNVKGSSSSRSKRTVISNVKTYESKKTHW